MKASTAKSFSKKLSCPSSSLLLSFRLQALVPEVSFLVKHHLGGCDFCFCELSLLAWYSASAKVDCRTPELPINLRELAESILGKTENAAGENSEGPKGRTFIDV